MSNTSVVSSTAATAAVTATPPLSVPQRAGARLQFGDRFSVASEVEATPAGLLAVGGMVGAALLGSAFIVWAARR
ncbi:hypothetical protein [Sphingomonas soli]|uniref:hypothetical protein n=1 Tax=Sphingomonas soli TaxID=266127 RepID=UPI00082DB569|nr:hypothetical protein [Sphingomonas soli]